MLPEEREQDKAHLMKLTFLGLKAEYIERRRIEIEALESDSGFDFLELGDASDAVVLVEQELKRR